MESFTVADFSGGVTDFVTRSSSRHMEESHNLVVTSDRKLTLREGVDFVEGSDAFYPEQKIFELAYIQTDASKDRVVLCDHNYYDFKALLQDFYLGPPDSSNERAFLKTIKSDVNNDPYIFTNGIETSSKAFALLNGEVIAGAERFGTQTNKLEDEPVRYPIYASAQWNDFLIVTSDGEPELPVSIIYKSKVKRPVDWTDVAEEDFVDVERGFTRSAGLGAIPSDIQEGKFGSSKNQPAISLVSASGGITPTKLDKSYRYAMCLANEFTVGNATHVERGPVYYFREPVRSDVLIGEIVPETVSLQGGVLRIDDNIKSMGVYETLTTFLPSNLTEEFKTLSSTDIMSYVRPGLTARTWQTEAYWKLNLEIYRTTEGTNNFFRVGTLPINDIDTLRDGLSGTTRTRATAILRANGLKTIAEQGQEAYDAYLERYFPSGGTGSDASKRRDFFVTTFSGNRDGFQSEFLRDNENFNDFIRDEDLVLNLPLYTNAEASLDLLPDNEQPPACKFVHALNDVIYYANYKGNANVVLQSKAARPGAVFFDDPMILEEPVTALSSIYGRLLAFTKNRVYRFTGTPLTDDFTGGLTPEEIEHTAGCISNRSIVQTSKGLLFFGPTGIYETNGLQVSKLTDHLNESYKEWIDSVEDPRLIKGCYDEENQRVLWSLPEKFERDAGTFTFDDLGSDKEKLPRALYLVMDLRHGRCFTTKTFAVSRSLANAKVDDRVELTGGYNTPVPALEDFQKRWAEEWVPNASANQIDSAKTLADDVSFQEAMLPPVVRGWWQGVYAINRSGEDKTDNVLKGREDYFGPREFRTESQPFFFGNGGRFLNEFAPVIKTAEFVSRGPGRPVSIQDRYAIKSNSATPEPVSIPYRYASTHMDMGKKAQKKYGPKMLLSFQMDADLKTRFADVNDGDRGQYADHSRDIVLHQGLSLDDRAVGRASTETFGYTSGAMQDIWFWLTKMRFEYKQVTFENIDDTIGLDFYLQHYIMYYNVLSGMAQRNLGRV